jgi:dienelactone hydrolase
MRATAQSGCWQGAAVTDGIVEPGDDDRYSALFDRVLPLYQRGQYADALADVRATAGELSQHRSDAAHLAACLLALEGRADEALAELRRAFDDGGWWSRPVLEDEDLASLSAREGFARLVDESDRRCRESQVAANEMVVVGSVEGARALLVALHGANSDGPLTAATWRPLAVDGVLLAAPTSSLRTTPTHRTWHDGAAEWADIAQVATLLVGAAVPVVAGGFSAGGRQAFQWALSPRDVLPSGEPTASAGLVPIAFLLVCPAIDVSRFDPAAVPAAVARGLRGHVVLGEEDEGTEAAVAAVEMLRAEGLDVTVDLVDGLTHDYPDDFVERTRPVLDRLLA